MWVACARVVVDDADYEGSPVKVLAKAVLGLVRVEEERRGREAAEAQREAAEAREEKERRRANQLAFPSTASSLPSSDPVSGATALQALVADAHFPAWDEETEAETYRREADHNTSLAFGSSAGSSTNPRTGRPYALSAGPKVKMSGFRRQFVFGTESEMEVMLWEVADDEHVCAVVADALFGSDVGETHAFVETHAQELRALRAAWAGASEVRTLAEPSEFQPMFMLWLAHVVHGVAAALSGDGGWLEVRAANAVGLEVATATVGGPKQLVGKSDVFVVKSGAWGAGASEGNEAERAAAQLAAVVAHVELKSPFTFLCAAPAYQAKEQLLAETEAVAAMSAARRANPTVGLLTDGFVVNVEMVGEDGVHWLAPRVLCARTYVLRLLLSLGLGLGLVDPELVGAGAASAADASVVDVYEELEEGDGEDDAEESDGNDNADQNNDGGGVAGSSANAFVPGTKAYAVRRLLAWDAERRGEVWATAEVLAELNARS